MNKHAPDPAACQHHWQAKGKDHYCILDRSHKGDHQCGCGLEPSGEYGKAVSGDVFGDPGT